MGERVPGATGADGTEAFARLLRELKDRSGLSYGALAKRLHMSTSTLHRYCNGTAVPVAYAPVERLARVCRATPQELVELHRRWILADAARGSRAEQVTATDPGLPASHGQDEGISEGKDEGENGAPVVVDAPREPAPPRRRRTVLIASVAAVAVLGAVVLTLRPPFGGGNDTSGRPTAGAKEDKPSAPASSAPGSRGRTTDGSATGALPLAVGIRPYVYDDPCSQHFLVDSDPEQVGPPANEQEAPRWAAAYGAVASGAQRVALTVRGTGEDTVVLEALHIRVITKGAPLTWNDYAMGVGCGGGAETKSFDIDLDNGSPTVTVKNGQRDFPYKVSASDSEVFYVTAHTKAHDVRWDLTLDWTSGSRRGTVHIDNDGTPFRTSAGMGRPGYDYPLGGSEWTERKS